MRTSPNDVNALFNRDEEFRQTVIRQAIMLGMQAKEIPIFTHDGPKPGRWKLFWNEQEYSGYVSLYSAALDYLRLAKFPAELIGVVRHAKIQDT